MENRESGYLSTSGDGERTRLFTRGGEYVDINPTKIVATERLDDDDSGLAVWQVDHIDDAPERGTLVDDDLDRLFATEGDSPLADVAVAPTKMIHCPPTVPLRNCIDSKFGPCFP